MRRASKSGRGSGNSGIVLNGRRHRPLDGVRVSEGRGWFLGYHCLTKHVKVSFFRGASLLPIPPGASKQKDVRYLDIFEDIAFDKQFMAEWISQASELPGWTP